MNTTPLLDFTNAKEFAQTPDQLRELAITFAQSLDEEMALIRKAIAAGDGAQLERSLHALKGFVPIFARRDVGDTLIQLYAACRGQPIEVIVAGFTPLVPSLDGLIRELKDWLAAL